MRRATGSRIGAEWLVLRAGVPMLVFALLSLAGCGDDTGDGPDPCPGGICPADTSGRDGSVGTDGRVPPRDTGTPGGCVWQCSSWDTGGSGDMASRTCVETAGCGTTDGKPAESAMLPALDPEFYECNVEPIVTRKCSQQGCHGVETGRAYRLYARGRLRVTGDTFVETGCQSVGTRKPSESCIGSIECICWTMGITDTERQRSFDSARGMALGPDGTILGDVTQSELLAQPVIGGGFAHADVHFWTPSDSDYQTIQMWLEGATRGSACNSGN